MEIVSYFISTISEAGNKEKAGITDVEKIVVGLPNQYLLKTVNISLHTTLENEVTEKKVDEIKLREERGQPLTDEEKLILFLDKKRDNLAEREIGFEFFIAQLLDLINRITVNLKLSQKDASGALKRKQNILKNIDS